MNFFSKQVFDFYDSIIIVFLAFLALGMRLWRFEYPDSVIFDEVYFGNFTNWYIKQSYFFDIHPPLGKLIMAGIAKATQYDGSIVFAKQNYENYKENEINYVSLRLTPIVFQSFCFPLLYSALRLLMFPRYTCFAGAFILIFDTSIITEGKFILSDGMLHFFSCLSIYCTALLLHEDTKKNVVLCGLALGCAISCKNTALGLVAFVGFTQICWIFLRRPFFYEILNRASNLLSIAFLVLVSAYALHFILLPYDGMGTCYMPEDIQKTILKNSSYKALRLAKPPLINRIGQLIYIMHTGNMKITTPHPSQSMPINWPLLRDKFVRFFSRDVRNIMCMGSPLVFWPSTAGVALFPVLSLMKLCDVRQAYLFVGWAASFFPFVLIPRSMYLYHYIIPLFFAVMTLVTVIDGALPKRLCRLTLSLLMIAAVVGFVYFSPFVYGLPLKDWRARMWDERWYKGPPKELIDDDTLGNTTVLYGTLPEW